MLYNFLTVKCKKVNIHFTIESYTHCLNFYFNFFVPELQYIVEFTSYLDVPKGKNSQH